MLNPRETSSEIRALAEDAVTSWSAYEAQLRYLRSTFESLLIELKHIEGGNLTRKTYVQQKLADCEHFLFQLNKLIKVRTELPGLKSLFSASCRTEPECLEILQATVCAPLLTKKHTEKECSLSQTELSHRERQLPSLLCDATMSLNEMWSIIKSRALAISREQQGEDSQDQPLNTCSCSSESLYLRIWRMHIVNAEWLLRLGFERIRRREEEIKEIQQEILLSLRNKDFSHLERIIQPHIASSEKKLSYSERLNINSSYPSQDLPDYRKTPKNRDMMKCTNLSRPTSIVSEIGSPSQSRHSTSLPLFEKSDSYENDIKYYEAQQDTNNVLADIDRVDNSFDTCAPLTLQHQSTIRSYCQCPEETARQSNFGSQHSLSNGHQNGLRKCLHILSLRRRLHFRGSLKSRSSHYNTTKFPSLKLNQRNARRSKTPFHPFTRQKKSLREKFLSLGDSHNVSFVGFSDALENLKRKMSKSPPNVYYSWRERNAIMHNIMKIQSHKVTNELVLENPLHDDSIWDRQDTPSPTWLNVNQKDDSSFLDKQTRDENKVYWLNQSDSLCSHCDHKDLPFNKKHSSLSERFYLLRKQQRFNKVSRPTHLKKFLSWRNKPSYGFQAPFTHRFDSRTLNQRKFSKRPPFQILKGPYIYNVDYNESLCLVGKLLNVKQQKSVMLPRSLTLKSRLCDPTCTQNPFRKLILMNERVSAEGYPKFLCHERSKTVNHVRGDNGLIPVRNVSKIFIQPIPKQFRIMEIAIFESTLLQMFSASTVPRFFLHISSDIQQAIHLNKETRNIFFHIPPLTLTVSQNLNLDNTHEIAVSSTNLILRFLLKKSIRQLPGFQTINHVTAVTTGTESSNQRSGKQKLVKRLHKTVVQYPIKKKNVYFNAYFCNAIRFLMNNGGTLDGDRSARAVPSSMVTGVLINFQHKTQHPRIMDFDNDDAKSIQYELIRHPTKKNQPDMEGDLVQGFFFKSYSKTRLAHINEHSIRHRLKSATIHNHDNEQRKTLTLKKNKSFMTLQQPSLDAHEGPLLESPLRRCKYLDSSLESEGRHLAKRRNKFCKSEYTHFAFSDVSSTNTNKRCRIYNVVAIQLEPTPMLNKTDYQSTNYEYLSEGDHLSRVSKFYVNHSREEPLFVQYVKQPNYIAKEFRDSPSNLKKGKGSTKKNTFLRSLRSTLQRRRQRRSQLRSFTYKKNIASTLPNLSQASVNPHRRNSEATTLLNDTIKTRNVHEDLIKNEINQDIKSVMMIKDCPETSLCVKQGLSGEIFDEIRSRELFHLTKSTGIGSADIDTPLVAQRQCEEAFEWLKCCREAETSEDEEAFLTNSYASLLQKHQEMRHKALEICQRLNNYNLPFTGPLISRRVLVTNKNKKHSSMTIKESSGLTEKKKYPETMLIGTTFSAASNAGCVNSKIESIWEEDSIERKNMAQNCFTESEKTSETNDYTRLTSESISIHSSSNGFPENLNGLCPESSGNYCDRPNIIHVDPKNHNDNGSTQKNRKEEIYNKKHIQDKLLEPVYNRSILNKRVSFEKFDIPINNRSRFPGYHDITMKHSIVDDITGYWNSLCYMHEDDLTNKNTQSEGPKPATCTMDPEVPQSSRRTHQVQFASRTRILASRRRLPSWLSVILCCDDETIEKYLRKYIYSWKSLCDIGTLYLLEDVFFGTTKFSSKIKHLSKCAQLAACFVRVTSKY